MTGAAHLPTLTYQAHKLAKLDKIERRDRLAYTSHPTRQLTRRVHVMRLRILRELLLRAQIHFDHRRSQRIRVAAEMIVESENGAVECAIDLRKRRLARIVDIHNGHMSEEALGQRIAARICRRIARADELDALKRNPLLITRPIEAVLQTRTCVCLQSFVVQNQTCATS